MSRRFIIGNVDPTTGYPGIVSNPKPALRPRSNRHGNDSLDTLPKLSMGKDEEDLLRCLI